MKLPKPERCTVEIKMMQDSTGLYLPTNMIVVFAPRDKVMQIEKFKSERRCNVY